MSATILDGRVAAREIRAEVARQVEELVSTGGRPPGLSDMRSRGEAHDVPTGDLDEFATVALGLLVDLHEGTIARYDIRPSEFQAWKARVKSAS